MTTAIPQATIFDAIPWVRNTADRAAKYPAPTPNQRIQRLDTGAIEKWTGSTWVTAVSTGIGVVVVTDFAGVDATGAADSSTGIQAAIATGKTVEFPEGNYRCANLTQSIDYQRFVGRGSVWITKSANGPILTASGNGIQLENLKFRGESASPAFTGHNLVFSGNNVLLENCGSRWAFARAVLATGGRLQILGTNDIYQTTDATSGGFDIEIGVSGTATLYHQLVNIYTSQATGGIKMTDVGGHSIQGGQFGKLSILKGTGPAGTNGGMVVACRILGNLQIELDSCLFAACEVGAVVLTFATGTPGCSFGISNTLQGGGSIVNTGGAFVQQPGLTTGSQVFSGQVEVPNNKGFMSRKSDGTAGGSTFMSASDNMQVNNPVADKAIQIQQLGAAGVIQRAVDGVVSDQVDKSAVAHDTRLLVYDVDKAAIARVSVGINDSGGAGFKLLRVPN